MGAPPTTNITHEEEKGKQARRRGGEHVRERERKKTNKMEVNTYTPAGLKALNDHLTEESYISGYVAEKNEKNWVGCERNQRN